MQLVDDPSEQILANRGAPPADLDVAIASRSLRLFEGSIDPVGDEVEGRPALHLDWCALVVSQNEHGGMVGRGVAPPTLPGFVRPRSTDRAEHIAAQDKCAEPLHGTGCVFLINAVRSAALT